MGTDSRALAAAAADPVGRLGGAFMISREARAYSERVGLKGWSPYMRGRCGVLGEVDADVVAAAAAFFPAQAVRRAWEAGRELPAAEAAGLYAGVCQDFGRRKLAGFAGAGRLAGLLLKVVRAGAVTGTPLFAGWRAMPLPDDDPARALQLAHVLRELRGGLHAVAVLACGLTPLQAVLTAGKAPPRATGGADNARFFGWPEPYPESGDDERERRSRAERLTDDLMAPAFAVLDDGEAADLTRLLDEACALAFADRR
jgi:hypothetical protein